MKQAIDYDLQPVFYFVNILRYKKIATKLQFDGENKIAEDLAMSKHILNIFYRIMLILSRII